MNGIGSRESLVINSDLAEEFADSYRRERRIGRIANWFLGSSFVALIGTTVESTISERGLSVYTAIAGLSLTLANIYNIRGGLQQKQLSEEREAMGFTQDQQEHILHINGLE